MAESTSDTENLKTPQVTEKAEDEGGKGKKAIDQAGIQPQSNNVPYMFPPLLPDGSENIESLLLARNRHYDFEELGKNIIGDTQILEWYDGVEKRLSKSKTELGQKMDLYSEEELGRMMARSGLLLLEFLRFLASIDLPWSSRFLTFPSIKELFQPKERQLSVQEAVIKIDNQMPFFVLKKILEWERDADNKCRICHSLVIPGVHSILKRAWLKLSPIRYRCDSQDSRVIAGVPLKDDSHLLEFVYENIIGSSDFKHDYKWRKNKRRVRHTTLLRADQLKGKGVKFARNEGLLQKIRFDRRNLTLYLPAIEMDSGTDAVLRNLVLFESSKHVKESQPLMSYVQLMDHLIDTAEDVQALVEGGIIHHNLDSNNEVAHVWNGMCKLIDKKMKYEPIDKAIYDVRRFCKSKDRILLAGLRRIAWIQCILLALTVLQTFLAWEQVRLQRGSMPKT